MLLAIVLTQTKLTNERTIVANFIKYAVIIVADSQPDIPSRTPTKWQLSVRSLALCTNQSVAATQTKAIHTRLALVGARLSSHKCVKVSLQALTCRGVSVSGSKTLIAGVRPDR